MEKKFIKNLWVKMVFAYPRRLVFSLIILSSFLSLSNGFCQSHWEDIIENDNLQFPDDSQWMNYTLNPEFEQFRFDQPVQIVFQKTLPNGFFIVEKTGKIILIPDRRTIERFEFLNLSHRIRTTSESGLLSLAFHPRFDKNHRLFVFYTGEEKVSSGYKHTNRISEFIVSPSNPFSVVESSEKIILDQPDRDPDHNGGGLMFGHDDFLYFSIGDEGSFYDAFGNGQSLAGDLFAGIFRIDIDQRPGNRKVFDSLTGDYQYSIPSDNPFEKSKSHDGTNPNLIRRGEYFASGLRNPWRFAFDPQTNTLYSGDTGGHTREEINQIISGGNYGWPHREGSLPGPPRHAIHDSSHGFIDPIAEYGRQDGNDIAGFTVYRGNKFPELDGSVIFSDFYGGWVGSVNIGANELPEIMWLTQDAHIADISIDPFNGNILMVDTFDGQIKRLSRTHSQNKSSIPQMLSETGAFTDTKLFKVNPCFIPYEVNHPFWSDNAFKQRWVSFNQTNPKLQYRQDESWGFPLGTVFMKQFNLHTNDNGVTGQIRIETRFIILSESGKIYGISYRWNEDQDDAELVPFKGMTAAIHHQGIQHDGPDKWVFPSRHECMSCHNGGPNFRPATQFGRYVLGFNTEQLNKELEGIPHNYNQLEAMNLAGVLEPRLTQPVRSLPRLARPNDSSASLGYRVKSYLASNCVACHEGIAGIARLPWLANFDASMEQTGLIDVAPYNNMGISGSRLIHRTDPSKSILLQRINHLGPQRMPPVGSSMLDYEHIGLIKKWILEDLGKPISYTDWMNLFFESSTAEEASMLADPDNDGVINLIESITRTNPLDEEDYLKIVVHRDKEGLRIELPGLSDRYIWVEWTENPSQSESWRFLDIEGNEFFFPLSSETRNLTISEPTLRGAFFRLKIKL